MNIIINDLSKEQILFGARKIIERFKIEYGYLLKSGCDFENIILAVIKNSIDNGDNEDFEDNLIKETRSAIIKYIRDNNDNESMIKNVLLDFINSKFDHDYNYASSIGNIRKLFFCMKMLKCPFDIMLLASLLKENKLFYHATEVFYEVNKDKFNSNQYLMLWGFSLGILLGLYADMNHLSICSTNGDNYITVRDKSKGYDEGLSYISIETGATVYEKPADLRPSGKTSTDPWEEYTNIEKFTCDDKYGLKQGDTTILPCEYSNIDYMTLESYKYIESKGKSFVFAAKDDKAHLIDLKTGTAVKTIDTRFVHSLHSSFVYYEQGDKVIMYNVLTNKEMEFDTHPVETMPGYFTMKDSGQKIYYNTNFEKIFVEELEK